MAARLCRAKKLPAIQLVQRTINLRVNLAQSLMPMSVLVSQKR
jgi:hypothetical protein